MALVGIISDTHGTLDPRAYEALSGSDYIIHAGDICSPLILDELETLAPVTAVLGNNDLPEYGSRVDRYAHLVVDGVRFLVAHYPQDVTASGLGSSALEPGDPVPDVCVHGHTHVPCITVGSRARPASMLLCPGSATRPRNASPRCVAHMRVEDGRVLGARIVSLDGAEVLCVGERI